MLNLLNIEKQSYDTARELLAAAGVKPGRILAVGCSSSEVNGETIGKRSSPETARAIYAGISKAAGEFGVYVAAQCCEHLNRRIVVERRAVKAALDAGVLQPVNVVPQPKAGGSFATRAYENFSDPVVLEEIKADCGLDIGGTLIGMQLKKVAVPVRLYANKIGRAAVIAARTRNRFIGGARAVYDEKQL